MDERRHRGRVVSRIAEHVLVGEGVEELQKAVCNGLLDEQTCPRETDLTGIVVLAGGLPRSRLQVGVREHEERTLAAKLGGERHEISRSRLADRSARLR